MSYHRIIVLDPGAHATDVPTEAYEQATLILEPRPEGGPMIVQKDRYDLFKGETPAGFVQHPSPLRNKPEVLTEQQLLARIDRSGVTAGTKWKHRRSGHSYLVLDVGVTEEDLEPVVTYCRVHDSRTPMFARPVEQFLEKFEEDT